MNVVRKHLDSGLALWKKLGARITLLKSFGISVPEIFLEARKTANKLVVITSGFHLEETSGPIFLLNPKMVISALGSTLEEKNVVIYPAINQYGLDFDESGPDKHLRYNSQGLNYNSYWGQKSKKCVEVELIEKRVVQLLRDYQMVFSVSLHEDSTEAGKGYLWMNNINKSDREYIQSTVERKVPQKHLVRFKNRKGLRQGKIERGFSVVDAKDDSFENFMSDILGVSSLLSEAPFGLSLKTRINFHKTVLSSIPL